MKENIKLSLNGTWTFKNASKHAEAYPTGKGSYMGFVPGTVHTDLLTNNLIPDPFFGLNEKDVQWVEECDWAYVREFELVEDHLSYSMAFLFLEGVDTVSDVFLNGKFLFRTTNMFVSHKVDIKSHLKRGVNKLQIILRSPTKYAQEQEKKYGKIFAELDSYRVHIRKAQYSFGWDWGPRLATSGIWKDVYIVFSESAVIESISIQTSKVLMNGALIQIHTSALTNGFSRHHLRWMISIDDKPQPQIYEFPFSKKLHRELKVVNVEPWWTHDLGSQHLYNCTVSLLGDEDHLIESKFLQTGFRKIELERKNDSIGESFIFRLNGKRVFIKGADWIPMDSFVTRPDSGDYKALILASKEAGLNMLRVWGGGIYEREEFYRECDASGLLVWQDFMFACASYPENDEFIKSVKIEAAQNVRRISNHPCVSIFCGNNESEWIWHSKTGRNVNDMPGAKIFKDLLPGVVKSISPGISYWRSSPFGGDDPNSETEGNHHEWNIWSGYKSFREYEKVNPRFVTEFGFQAPPSLRTIDTFTLKTDRYIQSRVMRHHNKQLEGTERLFKFLSGEVRIASDFRQQILQMQLVQAKAVKTGMLHWRARKWKTAGAIFWQLNDCWPVSSWSAVDYKKRPKALYYWAKEFNKPVKLIFQKEGTYAYPIIVNDVMKSLNGDIELSIMRVNGIIEEKISKQVRVSENSVVKLRDMKLRIPEPESLVLVGKFVNSETGNKIDMDDYIDSPWLDFQFKVPEIIFEISDYDASMKKITFVSDSFIHGVYVDLGEQVGEASDNFFTLYPNIKKEVLVKADLLEKPVNLLTPLIVV
ncbi:MAG: glycoside hydrolase family 2 protein [Candidatus Kryptoniota bacterium]